MYMYICNENQLLSADPERYDAPRPGHAPHLVHPYSPFDVEDWDAMTYWARFETFYAGSLRASIKDSVKGILTS